MVSFRCAKCHERVTADTNLLLLSDGSPVCGSCSYNCNVCKLPILDEAIMTGDESYHAACFTCRSCSRQIQELVFAKTSNGIYCMTCHNERVARSRRHAEQKRNKSKTAAARKDKEKERERRKDVPATPSRPGLSPNATNASPSISATNSPSVLDTPASISGPSQNSASPTPGASIQNAQASYPFPAKRMSTQSIPRVLDDISPAPSISGIPASNSVPVSNGNLDRNPVIRHSDFEYSNLEERPGSDAVETQSLIDDDKRHKAYDDGVRPLSYFLSPKPAQPSKPSVNGLGMGSSDLNVPQTSRKDKRRSINPGLVLDSSTILSMTDGPLSSSPPSQSRGSMDKHSVINGRLSPNPASPLRTSFGETPESRDSLYFSPAASPVPGSRPTAHSSRSPSPQPGSFSSPNLTGAHPATPPSLSVIQPSPGPSPVAQRVPGVQPPPRTNSLPNTGQLGDRDGRSASRSPSRLGQDRSRSRGASPSPSDRGRQYANSPSNFSDGAETDGDVVVMPREGPRRSLEDRPPPPPPKETPLVPTEAQADDDDDDDEVGVVQEKSSTPFLAPALPPMRFSISDTDFSKLLTSIGDPTLSSPPQHKEEKSNNGEAESLASDSPDPSADNAEDLTVVIPPTPQEQTQSVDGRAHSPVPNTPTSMRTVTDEQHRTLAVDIPGREAMRKDDAPPTPPPSSTKSSSSIASSNAFPSMSTIATNRGVAVPMSLHQSAVLAAADQRQRVDSSASVPSLPALTMPSQPASGASSSSSLPVISVSTAPGGRPPVIRSDSSSTDLVSRRLKEALKDTNERGSTTVKLDREFVEAIIIALDNSRERATELKGQIDTMKRTSQQVMTGLTVAQSEYHKEIAGRRDAEAEVTRLRVQLSGQAARLTALSAEHRRQEMMEQMSRDLNKNLGLLEKDVSKLKVERDMTLAEVEELSNNDPKSPVLTDGGSGLTRSLTTRFDNLKSQYRKDLEPLRQQREALLREIQELKEARDIFLEETTALNARNEELADLNAQIARQIEVAVSDSGASDLNLAAGEATSPISSNESGSIARPSKGGLFGKNKVYNGGPSNSTSFSSVNTGVTTIDEREEFTRVPSNQKPLPQRAETPASDSSTPVAKSGSKFKWFGGAYGSKEKKPKPKAHNFQQQNVMRFARCDHCGDKMWGAQLKCSGCGIACHPKCNTGIQTACQPSNHVQKEESFPTEIAPLPPSMFGRDLVEQVRADAAFRGQDRAVPVIVEKCIQAVEVLAMDYEGIYRKTGGSSQSKAITQLFERGNYDSFDLLDTEAFNDICSVTSVLKTYFRSLPNPLLTYALHDQFVAAAGIKEQHEKHKTLLGLVTKLPREHYHTLRVLMLHLHRIQERSDENLMNSRNLGVVFGPTLMRSDDSAKEFADMAGKALSIQWFVENAPEIFHDASAPQ